MTSVEIEAQIKHVQAVNQLLADYNKTQAEVIKHLRGMLIVLFLCFTAIICTMVSGFFWYESQFETREVTTTTLETEGDDADINSVTNGNMYNDNAIHNE